MNTRKDGRQPDELRHINITRNVSKYALGSVLIEMGDTRVLCCATIEDKVPPFLQGTGNGWITAEYGMLPVSTPERILRTNSQSGRSQEIRRMIGRALRAAVNLRNIGERTIIVDCDVIQADGGTRTASINGSFCAVVDTLVQMKRRNLITLPVLRSCIGAVSVGIVNGNKYLDLNYSEDSMAQLDFNVVMNNKGNFIEIQGAAEGMDFSFNELSELISIAEKGIKKIIKIEEEFLKNELQILSGY
ncbi:MAG: ribonuclease PH [Candidatus Omnitrophica bacterium]|nr:ribonuclease PH [Candidatus Omnitrophota bacterium]MCM8816538.1 ribonuclease PH [Candidatus Omnitrophota bacterium]